MVEEKKKSKNGIKWIAGGIVVFIWAVLISMAVTTDISLKIPLIISIIVSVIAGILFFGTSLAGKFKKMKDKNEEDKIPEPISEEEVMKIVEKRVGDMWNHIVKGSKIDNRTHTINKNLIYEFKVKLLLEEEFEKKSVRECYIIVNATYPKRIPTILSPSTSNPKLESEMNKISNDPKDDPNTKITETKNEILGTQSTTKETFQNSPETKKDKEEEESVV